MQLDDVDEDELYPMTYDAVLKYANQFIGSFSSFRLQIHHPLIYPGNKLVNQNCKEYVRTNQESWNLLKDDTPTIRNINPIPYIGDLEKHIVKIMDKELQGHKDDNGDIQFFKVM